LAGCRPGVGILAALKKKPGDVLGHRRTVYVERHALRLIIRKRTGGSLSPARE